MRKGKKDALIQQSSSASDASATTSKSSTGSSGASSDRTLGDGGKAAGDEAADFARELEKYKSTLVFSNLPFTTSSSTTAKITHKSQYSTRTSSLITAMLGISISSSTTATTTYHLESALIQTLRLTQHNLVWMALLGHEQYKKEIMTAVRRNGGKMFLVVGVKVARDAEVQKDVSRGKIVSGKLQVDARSGVGVQGFPRVHVERIAGGQGEEGVGMGVVGSRTNGVVDEGGRRERLLGDRAFAVEYREVRLKIKLEVGGRRGDIAWQGNKRSDPGMKGGHSEMQAFKVRRKPVPPKLDITRAQLSNQAMFLRASKDVVSGLEPVASSYKEGSEAGKEVKKVEFQQPSSHQSASVFECRRGGHGAWVDGKQPFQRSDRLETASTSSLSVCERKRLPGQLFSEKKSPHTYHARKSGSFGEEEQDRESGHNRPRVERRIDFLCGDSGENTDMKDCFGGLDELLQQTQDGFAIDPPPAVTVASLVSGPKYCIVARAPSPVSDTLSPDTGSLGSDDIIARVECKLGEGPFSGFECGDSGEDTDMEDCFGGLDELLQQTQDGFVIDPEYCISSRGGGPFSGFENSIADIITARCEATNAPNVWFEGSCHECDACDEYELELGEEVIVQEFDALW